MERKAVSPDSSTQLAEKSKKSAKRKHKDRDRKKSKKSKSSGPPQDIENDDINTGSKNTKPSASNERVRHLTEFLDDRKELHTQLFSIIPKKEVKEMMPDILKKLSFKEVKKLCAEQLESLSKTQLKIIITGQEMASSEDESIDKEGGVEETQLRKQNMNEKGKRVKHTGDVNTQNYQSKISKSVREGKEEEKKENDMIIFEEMITIPNQEEIDELVEGNCTAQQQATEDTSHSTEGTVVEEAELRELEFRARALESLVRARERQMRT